MNTQLNESTYQNSLKSPKLLSQRIRKRYYKTLGTGVINSPMTPPSLRKVSHVNMWIRCEELVNKMSAQGAQIKKDIEFSVHHNKTTNPPIQSVNTILPMDSIVKILNVEE